MFILESEVYRLTNKLRQLEAFSLQKTEKYKRILKRLKKVSKRLEKARKFFNKEMEKNTKAYFIKSSYDN